MKPQSFDDLYREAESHEDYWVAGLVHDFTEEIVRLMEDGGVSRSELARRLGTSPAYVTKILRGNANFTLATMIRVARALGAELKVGLQPASQSRKVKSRGRVTSQQGNRDQRSTDPLVTSSPAAAS